MGLTLVDQYEIVAAIARGGMGRVYRAVQLALGRDVALKVLDMEQLEGQAQSEDFQQRFFNEAAACAKLTHPNTVVVYDYGKTDDEIYFIVMELLAGQTLRQLIQAEGVIPPARAVHIALQICGSIGEAHEHGMVHRDLKPSNVMLTPRGNDDDYVKVLDFGLVKHEDHGMTQSGALLGTPRYMAPEQISGVEVTAASDIYSLGAILYHMLTGRPPFDSESKFVLLASHMNVAAPPIREVFPESPASEELQRAVMRCLLKEPGARFESMDALARTLAFCPEDTSTAPSSLPRESQRVTAAVLRDDELASTSAARPSVSRELALAAANATTLAEPAQEDAEEDDSPKTAVDVPPSASRGPLMILVSAVLIGAVLALGAAYVWKTGQAREDTEFTEPFERPTPAARDPDPTNLATPIDEPAMQNVAMTRVVVQSDPERARVRRGDRDLGDTPVTLVVPEGEMWELTVRARGHAPRTISITGGQESAYVRLVRQSSGMSMAAISREEPSPMVEAVTMDPVTMDPATMEPATTEPSTMSGTDNRDPWAQ